MQAHQVSNPVLNPSAGVFQPSAIQNFPAYPMILVPKLVPDVSQLLYVPIAPKQLPAQVPLIQTQLSTLPLQVGSIPFVQTTTPSTAEGLLMPRTSPNTQQHPSPAQAFQSGGEYFGEGGSEQLPQEDHHLIHSPDKTLFVGALPPDVTATELEQFFYYSVGETVKAKIIYDWVLLKSKQCALIFCPTQEACVKILAKPRIFHDRTLRVEWANPEKRGTKKLELNILFVGQLREEVSEEIVKCYFDNYGEILSVRFFKNQSTPRGFKNAFIKFTNDEAIVRVVSIKERHIVGGCIVKVAVFKPNQKGYKSAEAEGFIDQGTVEQVEDIQSQLSVLQRQQHSKIELSRQSEQNRKNSNQFVREPAPCNIDSAACLDESVSRLDDSYLPVGPYPNDLDQVPTMKLLKAEQQKTIQPDREVAEEKSELLNILQDLEQPEIIQQVKPYERKKPTPTIVSHSHQTSGAQIQQADQPNIFAPAGNFTKKQGKIQNKLKQTAISTKPTVENSLQFPESYQVQVGYPGEIECMESQSKHHSQILTTTKSTKPKSGSVQTTENDHSAFGSSESGWANSYEDIANPRIPYHLGTGSSQDFYGEEHRQEYQEANSYNPVYYNDAGLHETRGFSSLELQSSTPARGHKLGPNKHGAIQTKVGKGPKAVPDFENFAGIKMRRAVSYHEPEAVFPPRPYMPENYSGENYYYMQGGEAIPENLFTAPVDQPRQDWFDESQHGYHHRLGTLGEHLQFQHQPRYNPPQMQSPGTYHYEEESVYSQGWMGHTMPSSIQGMGGKQRAKKGKNEPEYYQSPEVLEQQQLCNNSISKTDSSTVKSVSQKSSIRGTGKLEVQKAWLGGAPEPSTAKPAQTTAKASRSMMVSPVAPIPNIDYYKEMKDANRDRYYYDSFTEPKDESGPHPRW